MTFKMNAYNEYIAKSRYARFLDNKGRREHWNETVSRYFDFMTKHLKKNHNYELTSELRGKLQDAVTALDVVPSMRAIMTAGDALERQNIAGYNCSYLPIDDPKAFDEAMYILLCGTGVGFSVEQKYVNKLPEIPSQLFESESMVVVKDSKEGWAKALRQVIALLYAGEIPKWDVSSVRPAGTRLKTFGGRASGPEPLVELFKYVVSKFKTATGRKLTSLEAHDILCKIGEVVVVGGVRRSAMISLSDLSDDRMAHAKAGNWWDGNGQRALANNSAVYDVRPDVGQFMREWSSIYESHSGERGIFNRYASELQAGKNGRRKLNQEWGTNPCSEIILRPYQFCNLSSVIVRSDDTVDRLRDKIAMATILGTFQSTLTHFPYLRKVWQTNTEEERLLGVSMTGILDNPLLNDPDNPDLPGLLEELKNVAVSVNSKYAADIGINPSVAITAIKPEGTVSQLSGTASGIHPQHARHYIRRVRSDNKDPLTDFLKAQGFPSEPCFMKPDSTTVFSFPMKVADGALLREDLDAIKHLRLWLMFQRHYCEHKPSVTISVQEHEWPKVGAWVWENFDEITGVSFLPMDGGTYRQAPYETIDQATYDKLAAEMPTGINWENFVENTDNVEGAQTLACTAGGCEI
jgi:ribonucleoside-diphosphate reductase alpha chain